MSRQTLNLDHPFERLSPYLFMDVVSFIVDNIKVIKLLSCRLRLCNCEQILSNETGVGYTDALCVKESQCRSVEFTDQRQSSVQLCCRLLHQSVGPRRSCSWLQDQRRCPCTASQSPLSVLQPVSLSCSMISRASFIVSNALDRRTRNSYEKLAPKTRTRNLHQIFDASLYLHATF